MHWVSTVSFQSVTALDNTPTHFSPGPFSQLVKKVLLVSNQNSAPVAFKVKTTAPKVRIPLSEQITASLRHLSAVLRPSQLG
jgi:hypothetical protein